MDPISLIVGAGIAASSFIAGRVSKRRHKQHESASVAASPAICGCQHELSFHDPKTNECHGRVDGDPIAFDRYREPTAYKRVRCSCRQYVGPVPADQILASFNLPQAIPQHEGGSDSSHEIDRT